MKERKRRRFHKKSKTYLPCLSLCQIIIQLQSMYINERIGVWKHLACIWSMQQPMHFDHLSSITAIAEFGLSETFLIFSKAKLNIKKNKKKLYIQET